MLTNSPLSNCLIGLQAIVTEEDGMESMAHRFLSAAVKVYFFLRMTIILLSLYLFRYFHSQLYKYRIITFWQKYSFKYTNTAAILKYK